MHNWMWMVLLTLGLIKLPLAALMLWIPFRSDAALESLPPAAPTSGDASEEDDGGSKTLPGGAGGDGRGRGPRVGGRHPRSPLGGRGPRRGPHGSPASPARIRTERRSATRIRARP